MPRNRLTINLLSLWLLAPAPLIAVSVAAATDDPRAALPPEQVEFFEKKIRPVLVEHCYECHSAEAKILQGNLRLDTAEGLRAGGSSGPAFEPDVDVDDALLLSALKYEAYEMPPTGQLPDEVIADFALWLKMGAPDPRTGEAAPTPVATENEVDPASHWSFQPPGKPAPPEVVHVDWPRTDIDRFILGRLEGAELAPSPQATPRSLLRRFYYDLTGLPPSADQLDAFAATPTDEAYEAAVDRLLDSSRFGERWARHWLDVARYADTKGYVFEEDRKYPGAYKYRDWVIEGFNNDVPYDQFIVAQLAADQLDDPEALPAMGFLTLGRRFLNNRHDIIDDRIDVASRGLMGLTVACARCHDHKYDPIPTADYYALYGVFASSEEQQHDDKPWTLIDAENPRDPVVFLRGSPSNRGPKVKRRFLSCLSEEQPPAPFEEGSGRLELAKAIASEDNPLTARVWVNRVWARLFGRGLVATPSDFGTRGEPPTHPKLLDWLARDFMENGWSTKRLVRQIVLSSVYRQSSDWRRDGETIDPENRLLWRANRRRLDLEALRDSLLLAAGQLDLAMGGPSVSLTEPPFSRRRAVYGYIERQNLPAFFRTFDFASPNAHTPQRPLTVAPQQALFLMNSPLVMQMAGALAERSQCAADIQCERDCRAAQKARVVALFRFALGRTPAKGEVDAALAFIEQRQDRATQREQLVANPWHFGWGELDDAGSLQFRPLPHFNGQQWQGGADVPDESLGWALLSATGGHPGDQRHPVIRRFIAPQSGTLRIDGQLKHPAEEGDGVRGRVVVAGRGALDEWTAAHGRTSTTLDAIDVERGEGIDFVVDCRESESHDSFQWEVVVTYIDSQPGEGSNNAGQARFASREGFHGPTEPPLSAWEQLAQVLLMSNEFAFVD